VKRRRHFEGVGIETNFDMGGASSMARASDKRLDGGVAEQCGGRTRRQVTKSFLTAVFNQQKTFISGFSLIRFVLWQSICVSHEEHMAVLNDPSTQAGTVPAADTCCVLSCAPNILSLT